MLLVELHHMSRKPVHSTLIAPNRRIFQDLRSAAGGSRVSRVHVWRSGGGGSAAADFPASPGASGPGLASQPRDRRVGLSGLSSGRGRRAPGDEDDGVGGGCNDGLSRRGR